MKYVSYRALTQKLQTLQDYSNLLTEYNCKEEELSELYGMMEKQVIAAQKRMDCKTLISAVRIDTPVDWHGPHAGTEEIQHLVHLVQP